MTFMARILMMGLVVLGSGAAFGELVDSVAAVVGQEVILLSELRSGGGSEIDEIRKNSGSKAEYEETLEAYFRETLEEAIATKILYREALRASVVVEDADVEGEIDNLRSNYDTNEEFMALLSKAGETLSDFRDRIRKQKMAQKMAMSKRISLEKNIAISESDVADYYNENPETFSQPERVYSRQIMIRSRRGTDERVAAKVLLEKVRGEILGGADFGEMARKHSTLDGAENGGIVGWQRRGELRPVLEDAAFALEAGEISAVVESQFGVHLIKVDEHEAAGGMELKDARPQIEPRLRMNRAAEQFEKWMNDLRRHSNVRVFL